MKYIDLTHTFSANMPVYPGDPLSELKRIDKDRIVDHQLTTGMHVGTHMDAPLHMIAGGKRLSEFDVGKFIGNGVLIDARNKEQVDVDSLDKIRIRDHDIVIIWTGFSEKFRTKPEEYYAKYPSISEELAKKFVELGVKIVGMDTPSPDRAPYKVHKILLEKEILIIENLTNVERLVGIKKFEIIALPAKFDTEAAPVRVIARVK
ncbi:cyclase family protein [Candidatus Micrarchaeota archaeon]|nr:cyclase family protein [Candidatus Micrarchaeota archaeon]